MSDIILGNSNTTFKVGSSDCTIYLGDTLLYPTEEPTPSYPYALLRTSRNGSAYTIACSSTSAQTVTSANTRSGLSNAVISGSSQTGTPVSIIFGDCCTSIGGKACSGWTYLTSITISNSVTSITNNGDSFRNCYRVEDLKIGSGITSLNGSIFYGLGTSASTRPNLDLSKNDGLVISGNTFSGTKLGEVKLPRNLSLYSGVFSQSHITSLKFGDNTTINDGTSSVNPFNLSEIGSIDLGNVISIGNYSFYSTYGYTSLTLPRGVTKIGNYAFSNSGNTSTLSSVVLDYNSNTTVGNGVFYKTTAITNLTIGEEVSSIGYSMFEGCTNLHNFTIPSNVTNIGQYAFKDCSSLTEINIPNSISVIDNGVFSGDTSLTSVTLGNNVTSIDSYAFEGCSGLVSVTINTVTPPTLYNVNAFNYTNNCPIYVPSQSVSSYKSASVWSTLADRIQAIPNS